MSEAKMRIVTIRVARKPFYTMNNATSSFSRYVFILLLKCIDANTSSNIQAVAVGIYIYVWLPMGAIR